MALLQIYALCRSLEQAMCLLGLLSLCQCSDNSIQQRVFHTSGLQNCPHASARATLDSTGIGLQQSSSLIVATDWIGTDRELSGVEFATDCQSASTSWCRAALWGLWPHFRCSLVWRVFLLHVGRPLSREDGSAFCSAHHSLVAKDS
jgi:hypothetical protein